MDRRFLLVAALISALLAVTGFFWLDRPLAEWVHASGWEDARIFDTGLEIFDIATGNAFWIFLLGLVTLAGGSFLIYRRTQLRLGYVLATAALVQLATIGTMSVGKDYFGRLRPHQVFDLGDWSHLWFAGGISFPSGHSAFYFGMALPLAAACSSRRLRAALLVIPLFVALARIDMAKHFLSDVSTSILIASIYALIAATLMRKRLPAP